MTTNNILDIQSIMSGLLQPTISTENVVSRLGLPKNYNKTHFDTLLQHFRNKKSVTENSLFDFISVENDPNFSRKNPINSEKLNKLISNVSLLSSAITTVTSQLQILRIYDYAPKNVKAYLGTLDGLISTSQNLLGNIKSKDIFKQIESSLLTDLLQIYFGKYINFSQLIYIFNEIENNVPSKEGLKNNKVRSLLGLGLQNLLPKDLMGVYNDTFQYINLLEELFSDINERNAFEYYLGTKTKQYQLKKVNQIVSESDYSNVAIDYDDPLGTVVIEKIQSALIKDYASFVDSIDYPIEVEDLVYLKSVLLNIGTDAIDKSLDLKNYYPSITECIKSISNISQAETLSIITNTKNKIAEQILLKANFGYIPNTNHMDYLLNLKKNLEARSEIISRGESLDIVKKIDNNIKSLIKQNNYTDSDITNLQEKIKELTNE